MCQMVRRGQSEELDGEAESVRAAVYSGTAARYTVDGGGGEHA